MSESNGNKKPTQVFRNEIRWLVFICLFIASILCNYFAVTTKVKSNAYRIGQIETARATAWDNYNSESKEQIIYLRVIRDDIIKIKTKLEIE